MSKQNQSEEKIIRIVFPETQLTLMTDIGLDWTFWSLIEKKSSSHTSV